MADNIPRFYRISLLRDFLRAQGVQLKPTRIIFPERLLKTKQEAEAIREAIKKTLTAFLSI